MKWHNAAQSAPATAGDGSESHTSYIHISKASVCNPMSLLHLSLRFHQKVCGLSSKQTRVVIWHMSNHMQYFLCFYKNIHVGLIVALLWEQRTPQNNKHGPTLNQLIRWLEILIIDHLSCPGPDAFSKTIRFRAIPWQDPIVQASRHLHVWSFHLGKSPEHTNARLLTVRRAATHDKALNKPVKVAGNARTQFVLESVTLWRQTPEMRTLICSSRNGRIDLRPCAHSASCACRMFSSEIVKKHVKNTNNPSPFQTVE